MKLGKKSSTNRAQNVRPCIYLLVAAATCVCTANSAAQATVNFTTTTPLSVPSRSNFSGANFEIFTTGTSYLDANMQKLATSLDLGWTRFPAGTADDYYDWTTGTTPYAWASQFANYNNYATVKSNEKIVGGRQGGVTLTDYGSFVATQRTAPTGVSGSSPTQTIGVINTFTDTPASAANLVSATAKAGIPVAVWELGNEPMYFATDNNGNQGFYPNATAYLNDVAAFATAIKQAVPGTKVAVWIPPSATDAWTKDTSKYASPFWDELYTHSYPSASQSDAGSQMEFYNGFLSTNTNTLVDSGLAGLFGSSMKIEWSEYNINPLADSVYNGLFVSEFAIRLSSDSHVTNVGMHALLGAEPTVEVALSEQYDYVNYAPSGATTVLEACAWSNSSNECTGTPINTSALNFNYFLTPSALDMQVINQPINTSAGLWPTTVTGSPTVTTILGSGTGSLPAVYAQAYKYAGQTKYVLLTNKSGSPVSVVIQENGTTLTEALTTATVGASCSTCETDTNTYNSTLVQLVNGTGTNGTVTVPAYGVMSVSWIE